MATAHISVATSEVGTASQATETSAVTQLFTRILVPFDHPRHSAVPMALQLAKMTSAAVYLLIVVEPCGGMSSFGHYEEPYRPTREEAAELLHKCKASLPSCLSVESLMRVGTASLEIANAAKEVRADLIVMGTHRRGAMKRLALGSTSSGVISKVRCPVLLVTDADDETIVGP